MRSSPLYPDADYYERLGEEREAAAEPSLGAILHADRCEGDLPDGSVESRYLSDVYRCRTPDGDGGFFAPTFTLYTWHQWY